MSQTPPETLPSSFPFEVRSDAPVARFLYAVAPMQHLHYECIGKVAIYVAATQHARTPLR